MPVRLRLPVALLAWLVTAPLAAQVSWQPHVALEGSLVLLTVRPDSAGGDSAAVVGGELAGEPLHFDSAGGGVRALGAVPLGTRDSIVARVVLERGGGVRDTLLVALPVRRRRTPRERLHVAPQYAQPPPSVAERIRRERELVQDVRRRAHDAPRLWRESFLRPSAGAVASGFGVARVFNGVVRSRHTGVDFAAVRGAPVRAANRGIVALVADLYFSGRTVLIDHGAGLVTGYFHLSRAVVAPGDTVARGQLIGRVGSSGRVTRPHLHWFAGYGLVTVDPLDLLRLKY